MSAHLYQDCGKEKKFMCGYCPKLTHNVKDVRSGSAQKAASGTTEDSACRTVITFVIALVAELSLSY
ncbi:unnamed protein product [Callosobruchus maculatus]|uniref:Uncharacterized protein n=1 Tax=Callosobruchus maculatus TaxID=64391 RepID=A0A653DL22_CALMS|nr:unnamed protein product [Callosobruchus maculatus]